MSIGIFTTDANLMIQSWDTRLSAMTGIDAEAYCGHFLTDVIPNLEQRGLLTPFQRVLTTGALEILAPPLYQPLIPCKPLNASPYFDQMQQRVTLTPIRDQGAIVGIVITLEDITARLDLERQLTEQLTRYPPPSIPAQVGTDPASELSPSTLLETLKSSSWQERSQAVEQWANRSEPEITAELIQLLRQEHRNSSVVNSIIQVLGATKVDVIPALVECCHDPDEELRLYAIQCLAQRRDPRAIAALVGTLKDEDQNVRVASIEALGELQALEAVDALIEIAQAEDFFLAFPALQALTRMGDASIASQLVPLLQKALNWRVRRETVDLLALQTDPSLTEDLIRLLREQHQNIDVLNSVLQILALSNVDPLPSLLECLHDPDADLRIYTALALGERHDERAIPALLEVLDDPDANVRYHTIEALGHLRSTEAVEPLTAIAESGDFFLAFPAIEALIRIGDRTIAPRLVPLLPNPLLCAQIVDALGCLGDGESIKPMASFLNTTEAPVQNIAIAISKIYHRYHSEFREGEHIAELTREVIQPTGVQNLIEALKSSKGDELKALVLILGWLSGEGVAKALTALLADAQLRDVVINALVQQGSRASHLLIAQLEAEDLETRKAAVIALGRIGSTLAVPALTGLLNAESELVLATTAALSEIGDQRAFEALLGLLGHPDSAVRLGAIAALNSLGHPELPKYIQGFMQDINPLMRESAVRIAGYFAFNECLEQLLALTQDPEERVRRAVIEQLPYVEDERVLPILIDALIHEISSVRVAATHALGDLDQLEVFPYLLEALLDSDLWVRYQAARSLGRSDALLEISDLLMEAPKTIACLYGWSCVTGIWSGFLFLASVVSLWSEIQTAVGSALHQIIQTDTAHPVRAAAVLALGRIAGNKAIPILSTLTEQDTTNSDVARAAVMALGQIHHGDVVGPLLMVLNSSNPERRLDALHAFRERGGEEAGVALQWMATADPEKRIVREAIESLSRMATSEAISALLELTINPESREACITALATQSRSNKILNIEAIEAIAQGLNHPHPGVRCAVIDVLKRLKHPLASEILIGALNDQDEGVRLAAVSALVYLGNQNCKLQLAVLARSDPSAAIRRAAQKGLHC